MKIHEDRITEIELNTIASTQGRFFRYVCEKTSVDIAKYIEAYMHSRLCKRMDSLYSNYHLAEPEELDEELKKEINIKTDPFARKYDGSYIYDAGYLYRYICRKYGLSSPEVYKRINLEQMVNNIKKYSDATYNEVANILVG